MSVMARELCVSSFAAVVSSNSSSSPGPADVNVISRHHTGEHGCAAFRHLDVIWSCCYPQVRWKIEPKQSLLYSVCFNNKLMY